MNNSIQHTTNSKPNIHDGIVDIIFVSGFICFINVFAEDIEQVVYMFILYNLDILFADSFGNEGGCQCVQSS